VVAVDYLGRWDDLSLNKRVCNAAHPVERGHELWARQHFRRFVLRGESQQL